MTPLLRRTGTACALLLLFAPIAGDPRQQSAGLSRRSAVAKNADGAEADRIVAERVLRLGAR
jgi:hypothetical protein